MAAEWRRKRERRRHFKEKMSLEEAHHHRRPWIRAWRKMRKERRKAVREEVDKFFNANFSREVRFFSWLANVVMVQKANEKWRMCIDYIDLNRACPKDAYSLPSNDRLVDGVSGFQLLRFLGSYSEYNQIRMHPPNKEKTTFITEDVNFCYRVMPFGLKNACATYQRLMDHVFKQQIR